MDASLLHAVVAAGYDRDFAEIAAAQLENQPARNNGFRAEGSVRTKEWNGFLFTGNRLTRTQYVTLDSGGIGKGLAADLVAESIVAAGAKGALVDLGGDIRAIGVDQHGRPGLCKRLMNAIPVLPGNCGVGRFRCRHCHEQCRAAPLEWWTPSDRSPNWTPKRKWRLLLLSVVTVHSPPMR